jgi:hypothetical protein
MKQYLLSSLALFLSIGFTSCDTTTSSASVEKQPVAAALAVASEPEEVAIEAISPSSAYSRKLRGVFVQSLTCTPNRIRLGDSIDVQIKEAWLEKVWEPKFGGVFGEDDFSKGYAQDSTLEFPRTQLVIAITPDSKLAHFDNSSWQLNLSTDIGKQHGFSRSRGNQLVMYFLRSNAVFPIKFHLLACPKPDPSCQQIPMDSLTISE